MFPSRLLLFTLSLLLLFSFFTSNTIYASDLDEEEDDKEFEELLALDEQEEQGGESTSSGKSEAEVLSKAQRIVLELNADNVKRVIDGTEYVLVLGYAPWCPRSAELMPKFAEAATLLKELNSPLLMAKLDADRHTKAAALLEIKGFPTLLLFVNGTSHPYSGGFSVNDIVIWARKKTGVPVVRVSSVKEAEGFLNKYHTFVLGVFDKFEGSDYEEFVKSATADNEIQFVETSSTEVAKVLYPNFKGAGQFLGIVKSEPERYTEYEGTFEMNNILQFLDYNKFPLVTKLTDINSVSVYSSPIKLQVMVFAKDAEFENLLGPLQSVARKFKGKLMFIYVDITDENNAKPFLTLFGLENSENVVVTAFDNRVSAKFLLEADPTQSNIEEFCSKFLSGTLSPHCKSQPIPDNVTNVKPQITVKSLSMHSFYIGEGTDSTGVPTKMLTVNGSLKISVYNPATIFGIHVTSSSVNLIYSQIVVATGQLKYYQPRKSHRTVTVELEGNKVPLYGAGSSLPVNPQTGGEVPLMLKFMVKSKGEVAGKLVKTTHKKQITCLLNVDILSNKPIKFKKHACTYE